MQPDENTERPRSVACIGAGNIGRAWAVLFSSAGYETRIYDPSEIALTRAERSIAEMLALLKERNLINAEKADKARGLIRPARSLNEALEAVQYVQESGPEDASVKRRIFVDLCKEAPPTALIGSSTSELQPTAFLTGFDGAARCLVVHPVNPPAFIPVVELCPSPETSEETISCVEKLMLSLGRKPIRLSTEISGYVLNRLQMALLSEALHLVERGICSTEDVDSAVRDGLGRRWVFMGPFMTAHLNAEGGIKQYFTKFASPIGKILADLKVMTEWDGSLLDRLESELIRRVPLEKVSDAQARRDAMLVAVAEFIESQNKEAQL